MSRRPAPSTTTVLLCRGCCCGTPAKHPRVDHDGQRDALERVADERADLAVRVVDCLDECERSNVVVVRRPALPARERDTWLGGVLTERATRALTTWLDEGAAHPLPDALRGLAFRHLPPGRRR